MLRSQSSLPYPALNSDNQGSVSTNHLWESHPEQNPFHCHDPFTGRCRKEGTVRAICFTSPGPLIWSSFGFLGSWHHRGRCSQPLCSVQRSWPTVYSGGCSFPLNWWTRGCELRCRKSQACEGPNRPSQWPALLTGGAGRGAASAGKRGRGDVWEGVAKTDNWKHEEISYFFVRKKGKNGEELNFQWSLIIKLRYWQGRWTQQINNYFPVIISQNGNIRQAGALGIFKSDILILGDIGICAKRFSFSPFPFSFPLPTAGWKGNGTLRHHFLACSVGSLSITQHSPKATVVGHSCWEGVCFFKHHWILWKRAQVSPLRKYGANYIFYL